MAQTVKKLKLVHSTRYPRQRLHTPSGTAKRGYKHMQEAQAYLANLLPSGWESYFVPRRGGKSWGLTVQCPICSRVPPPEVDYGLRKWRWLAVHISTDHNS